MANINIGGFSELLDSIKNMREEFEKMIKGAATLNTSLVGSAKNINQSGGYSLHGVGHAVNTYDPSQGFGRKFVSGKTKTNKDNVVPGRFGGSDDGGIPLAPPGSSGGGGDDTPPNNIPPAAGGGGNQRPPGTTVGYLTKAQRAAASVDALLGKSSNASMLDLIRAREGITEFNSNQTQRDNLLRNLAKSKSTLAPFISEDFVSAESTRKRASEQYSAAEKTFIEARKSADTAPREFAEAARKLAEAIKENKDASEKLSEVIEAASSAGGNGSGSGESPGFLKRTFGKGNLGNLSSLLIGAAGMGSAYFNTVGGVERQLAGSTLGTLRADAQSSRLAFSERQAASNVNNAENLFRYYGDIAFRGQPGSEFLGNAGQSRSQNLAGRNASLLLQSDRNRLFGSVLGTVGAVSAGAFGGAALGGAMGLGIGAVPGAIIGGASALALHSSGIGTGSDYLKFSQGGIAGTPLFGGLFGGQNTSSQIQLENIRQRQTMMRMEQYSIREQTLDMNRDKITGVQGIMDTRRAFSEGALTSGSRATNVLGLFSGVGSFEGITAEQVRARRDSNLSRVIGGLQSSRLAGLRNGTMDIFEAKQQLNLERDLKYKAELYDPAAVALDINQRDMNRRQAGVDARNGSRIRGISAMGLTIPEYQRRFNSVQSALGVGAAANEGEVNKLVGLGNSGFGDFSSQLQNVQSLNTIGGQRNSTSQLSSILSKAVALGFNTSEMAQRFTKGVESIAQSVDTTETEGLSQRLMRTVQLIAGDRPEGRERALQRAIGASGEVSNFTSQTGGPIGAVKALNLAFAGGSAQNGGSLIAGLNMEQTLGYMDQLKSGNIRDPQLRAILEKNGGDKSAVMGQLNASLQGPKQSAQSYILQFGKNGESLAKLTGAISQGSRSGNFKNATRQLDLIAADIATGSGMSFDAAAQLAVGLSGAGVSEGDLGKFKKQFETQSSSNRNKTVLDEEKKRLEFINTLTSKQVGLQQRGNLSRNDIEAYFKTNKDAQLTYAGKNGVSTLTNEDVLKGNKDKIDDAISNLSALDVINQTQAQVTDNTSAGNMDIHHFGLFAQQELQAVFQAAITNAGGTLKGVK